MVARDPFAFPKNKRSFRTMNEQFKRQGKRPLVGLTQGGSSRKGAPAVVAATDGKFRPSKKG